MIPPFGFELGNRGLFRAYHTSEFQGGKMKKSPSCTSLRLAVVDMAPRDYSELLAATGAPGVSLHFLVSGNDALQFARRWQAGLWLVNSQLCDMTGFELAETLRSTRPSALIFIIGDQYRLADELQTLSMGLAKYLCKPLEPSWVLPHEGESCIPLPMLRVAAHAPAAATKSAQRDFDTLRFSAAAGRPSLVRQWPGNSSLCRRRGAAAGGMRPTGWYSRISR